MSRFSPEDTRMAGMQKTDIKANLVVLRVVFDDNSVPHLLLFRQDHSVSTSGQSGWQSLLFRKGDDRALHDGIALRERLMGRLSSPIPNELCLPCYNTVESN